MAILVISFVAICVLRTTIQAAVVSNENASYYTAGVVEFRPAQYDHPLWTSRTQMEDNLKGFSDIIVSAEASETDIIVFPEMSLNSNDEATFVPEPINISISPCDKTTNEDGEKYEDFLIQLSCLARNVSKYIVINVCEKAYCESPNDDPRPCASTGLNIFNTNVVFDRNGVVISRYRKVNLWGEPRNTTFLPQYGYFDTDFGVRFGHFICFDLMFYTPAQAMVEKLGIRDFIFPTMWFSQLPFLTAVQIQSSWSFANDVNFLTAGASFPIVGTTGTGIYDGRRGAIHEVMSRKTGQRKLFVAQLQKRVSNVSRMKRDVLANINLKPMKRKIVDDIYLKRDYLEQYETLPISLTDGNSFEGKLCQKNDTTSTKFCCHFDLQWTEIRNGNETASTTNSTDRYSYRLGVYNGLRKEIAPDSNKMRNCALIACIGPELADCGKVFDKETSTKVVFERLAIEATFPVATELLIMPNSLKEDILPVGVSDFQWQESNQGTSRKVRYALKKPVSNLLTFSIYANYYDADAIDERDSANFLVISFPLFLLCAIITQLW